MQALPRAVLGVLRQLACAEPVLIAIDDEQWLDPASARVLAFALRRLREEPVAVILARRREPGGLLSTELSRSFGGDGLETIPLELLPIDTIKGLLEARLRRTISQPLLRRIHQGAGGNLLYALAIATELEARHASGDRAGDLPIARTVSTEQVSRVETTLLLTGPAMEGHRVAQARQLLWVPADRRWSAGVNGRSAASLHGAPAVIAMRY